MAIAQDGRFVRRIQLRTPITAHDDHHPFDIPAVQALAAGLDLAPGVTFLVGENGSGKSTLVEALAVACGFSAEGGSQNLRFATRPTHSDLHTRLVVTRGRRRPRTGFFLRAESFYNVLTALEELDAQPSPSPPLMPVYTGGRAGSLHERSHGESFWDLLINRFGPSGLYLLDEPEAALSPTRQLAALRRIHDLCRDGGQFVIATHSPLLLALPGASILLLDERGITAASYDDLPMVRLYRGLLANPDGIMGELLADDDDSA
ncbi:MAG: AAA family ATPase [Planctomycetes bacterium]|nr:AAA family ATPase [Planctomycetota bacterium]